MTSETMQVLACMVYLSREKRANDHFQSQLLWFVDNLKLPSELAHSKALHKLLVDNGKVGVYLRSLVKIQRDFTSKQ